jgi:Pyridoxal-dependent decarboxylase, pyridoxal binding domain
MTERIRDFLRNRRDDGPCLVVDLDVVRDNYLAFAKALPDTKVFYAVKANPAPELLELLVTLGSCFDAASVAEIEMVLAAGAGPERPRPRAWRHPVRRRLQGRSREDHAGGAWQPGVLPDSVRRHWRRLAAISKIWLRPCHGARCPRARVSARP